MYIVPLGYYTPSSVLATRLEALKNRTVGEADLTMARMIAMLSGDAEPTPELVLDVHGGLTYAGACQGRICHAPKPGEPDNVWWFGFDCAHHLDLSPGSRARMEAIMPPDLKPSAIDRDDVYRTLDYVRGEVNALAEQLAALKD